MKEAKELIKIAKSLISKDISVRVKDFHGKRKSLAVELAKELAPDNATSASVKTFGSSGDGVHIRYDTGDWLQSTDYYGKLKVEGTWKGNNVGVRMNTPPSSKGKYTTVSRLHRDIPDDEGGYDRDSWNEGFYTFQRLYDVLKSRGLVG